MFNRAQLSLPNKAPIKYKNTGISTQKYAPYDKLETFLQTVFHAWILDIVYQTNVNHFLFLRKLPLLNVDNFLIVTALSSITIFLDLKDINILLYINETVCSLGNNGQTVPNI
jgi:hypothetical protein